MCKWVPADFNAEGNLLIDWHPIPGGSRNSLSCLYTDLTVLTLVVDCVGSNMFRQFSVFSINTVKVHLTPKFFSAKMKLCNIHIKNLIILSVSGNFEGFKNWQKVAEICYQLVDDQVSRGLALFRNWRHRLIYMALTPCEHACKTVCDVKSRIDPSPSPAQSWDKEYQISGCTVAQKNFRC